MSVTELAVIGAGNMAEAIVRGVLKSGLLKPADVVAADVSADRLKLFAGQLGTRIAPDNAAAVTGAKRVLLSVKPQMMADVLKALGPVMPADCLVISIAAGVTARAIESSLGAEKPWRVIRTMPNTPMLVGQGMVGLSRGTHATAADAADARRLFEAAADVVEVPEDLLHAVTAVSGSGPAYFFFLIEQMIAAGVALGLTEAQARQLAAKTALGAAQMVVNSPDSPQELRRKVTSPNGTTHAAITRLQSAEVDRTLQEAVKAADARSRELAR